MTFSAADAAQAAADGLVVGEAAVAVQLDEVLARSGRCSRRPAGGGVAGDLHRLPGGEVAVGLLQQSAGTGREVADLGGVVAAGLGLLGLQLGDLPVQPGQGLLELQQISLLLREPFAGGMLGTSLSGCPSPMPARTPQVFDPEAQTRRASLVSVRQRYREDTPPAPSLASKFRRREWPRTTRTAQTSEE